MREEQAVRHYMPRNHFMSCNPSKVPAPTPIFDQSITDKAKADLLKRSFSREMGNEVYQLWLRGASRKSLAKKFGVSYPHICAIIRHIDRSQDPLL